MKNFAIKYVLVLCVLAFGFLGGFLYVKRNHVPQEEFVKCNEDFAKVSETALDWQGKFLQCVYYLNGVMEGKKGNK